MLEGINTIREDLLGTGYFIARSVDPNQTGLIGYHRTSITTDLADHEEKILTTNPNLAAAMIAILKEAGLQRGDYVAVGITGEFPGANLALFSAMEVLGLNPIIITTVAASSFGANRDFYTWLDMERALYDSRLLSFRTYYTTIGGLDDLGGGLMPDGIANILAAIERTERILIRENSFEQNINARLAAFESMLPRRMDDHGFFIADQYDVYFSAFINIGTSVTNVGSLHNARNLPTGIITSIYGFEDRDLGLLRTFYDRRLPFIHLEDMFIIVEQYNLERNLNPTPEPGVGTVFVQRIHNVPIAIVCWLILVGTIIYVVISDRNRRYFLNTMVAGEDDL
jgi:poly-gamma-glutamate system protein